MEEKNTQTILTCETMKQYDENNKNAVNEYKYLSNNDYIKLFYNKKNTSYNNNCFPLNVTYNKKKKKQKK